MKKLLIPIIAVVVVGVLAVVYFFVIAPGNKEEKEPEIVTAIYSPGENFIINVKGENGKESGRLFRAGIYLVVDERMLVDLSDSASATVPMMRDAILFALRDLTAAEILAPGGEDAIREKIVTTVNERLGLIDEPGKASPPKVIDVYFTDFVMQ